MRIGFRMETLDELRKKNVTQTLTALIETMRQEYNIEVIDINLDDRYELPCGYSSFVFTIEPLQETEELFFILKSGAFVLP